MDNLNQNKFLNTWQWQNFMFEKNIIESIEKGKKNFNIYKDIYQEDYKKFKIEVL